MDVPAFPAPPAPVPRPTSPPGARRPRRVLGLVPGCGRRRRPRSAGWPAGAPARRGGRVRPYLAAGPGRPRRLTAELRLTVTEVGYAAVPPPREEEEEEEEEPEERHGRLAAQPREELGERRSQRTIDEDRLDTRFPVDEANNEREHSPTSMIGPTISERPSPVRQDEPRQQGVVAAQPLSAQRDLRSTASQTLDRVLYRLRIFPTLKDIVDEESKPTDSKGSSRLFRYFRFLGRVSLCQFGLAWLLTLWAILGAGAFYITEGPREQEQVVELKDLQRDLAVGLATELRQLRADDKEMEPLWSNKVRQYVARHEKLLLIAVSSGYGEGGNNGQLWTFPGCILFAISVLTTLGFGAPVPRTNAGRAVAVIFAAVGIPAHFLLVLNLGLIFAVKLKRYGIRRKYPNECRDLETTDAMPIPLWVKIMPFLAIGVYYIIGILCFGVARLRPFYSSLLFPLDFTAAGGLSTITGYVRILYGVFLEGAILLTAIAVAIAKVSATQSLTNIGLKYGLLIPV